MRWMRRSARWIVLGFLLIGGLLFLTGGCIGAYNVWMTVRFAKPPLEKPGDAPAPAPSAGMAAQPAE